MKITIARQVKGFTLIELLLVIVIIGLAASITVISIGTSSDRGNLETYTKNLKNTLAFAIEEAVLFNQQLGLAVDVEIIDDQQRFVYYVLVFDQEKERWYEYQDQDLKKGVFPPDIDLTVEVDGEALTIGAVRETEIFKSEDDDDDDDDNKVKWLPDIIFFSSGETQKFTITISPLDNTEKRYQVLGNILGQLSLSLPGQSDD